MCKAVSRSGPLLHVSIYGTRKHAVGDEGKPHQGVAEEGRGFRQAMACTGHSVCQRWLTYQRQLPPPLRIVCVCDSNH